MGWRSSTLSKKLLRWPRAIDPRLGRRIDSILAGLPLAGRPVRVEFLASLTVRRRRLESGTGRGSQVHAASFLRRRRMVLEAELLAQPAELRRIVIHELFHFVWLRAGNPRRRSFERLLEGELDRLARGELGWSAQWRKDSLRPADRLRR